MRRAAKSASCFLALALSGCGYLPSEGPSASRVVEQAQDKGETRYEVVEIDDAVIQALKLRSFESSFSSFGDRRVAGEPTIGVGDTVVVNIWEAGPGGLFSGQTNSGSVSTGANEAALPAQVVGRDGGITVPYAGRVRVAGKTPRAVQTTIEKALAGKTQQPQVLVTDTVPVSSTVSVLGEATTGGRIPLPVNGARILDIIASAGGVRAPVNDTFVELSRGSRTTRVALNKVVSDPREDIYVLPNDRVTLIRDPQMFISYGATGAQAEVPFKAAGITLADALSMAGGLNDQRSDAHGVYVFRYEVEPVAQALRPESPLVGPGRLTPIAYHLELTDPKSLFLEQRFRIANRDLIYVSDSPSTTLQKALQIITGSVSPVTSTVGAANAASSYPIA